MVYKLKYNKSNKISEINNAKSGRCDFEFAKKYNKCNFNNILKYVINEGDDYPIFLKKKYQILSSVNEKINKNLKYRYGNTFNYI